MLHDYVLGMLKAQICCELYYKFEEPINLGQLAGLADLGLVE